MTFSIFTIANTNFYYDLVTIWSNTNAIQAFLNLLSQKREREKRILILG